MLFRYVDAAGGVAGPEPAANPNGSLRAIAGVMNRAGNVAGLMPHPERTSEAVLGSDDGLGAAGGARRERAERVRPARPVEVAVA